jgi:glycosyltransferase involved in cell wall biosynthesis
VRGNRADQLKQAVGRDDTNISFAGFAPEAQLERRLAAADIHLASLREEWTGLVVPSKFFGSLATGRPVAFAGSAQSGLARWIEEHRVGWVLGESNVEDVAQKLRELANQPDRLSDLQRHCLAVHQAHFARQRVADSWDRELRALITPRPSDK